MPMAISKNSEWPSMQVRSNYVSNSDPKDFQRSNLQRNKHFGVPSAPPFHESGHKLSQGVQHFPCTGVSCTLLTEESSNLVARKYTSMPKATVSDVDPRDHFSRSGDGVEIGASSTSLPARVPIFHASSLGSCFAVLSYDACVRLCLNSWAKGCMEASFFLENECALLQNAFGLRQILLQSEEELMANRSSELISEGPTSKTNIIIGKMIVQVLKIKMRTVVKMEATRYKTSNVQPQITAGWESLRKVRVSPRVPAHSSFSQQSLAYMHASAQYVKQVSERLKIGITSACKISTCEILPEPYTCLLRLISMSEEDTVRIQPGSGETYIFFPDSLGDDLVIEVQDMEGKYLGHVVAQVATIAEDQGDKVRWWTIYHEPDHEFVGRIQVCINYSTIKDGNCHPKCGSLAETVAYDLVLEVAMKAQHFQQRSLVLHDPWNWLLTKFASYYRVSDAYSRLRYLCYVMDVATPTVDCLVLVHDMLVRVIMEGRAKNTLSHQENRILGEVKDRIDKILCVVFENYKSLDESVLSGLMDVFKPASGYPAPSLKPAVRLYTLLHDILSPEAQKKLCSYFQVAAKKRSRRHLAETDEFVTCNGEATLMDKVAISIAYHKMKCLCLNIRNEIFTDMQIHGWHVLPSFIDLPNITSAIYSLELCTRLRAFLVACPPTAPSPPVAELVIVTSDFQRDLARWNINPGKGGVDAKELFHLHINVWIQDNRLSLLESCKVDKVKWSGVQTQHSTTPFVDDMYDRLKEMLNEYEFIMRRWPEYTFVLENAIADVEKAVLDVVEKKYVDVISPLKDKIAPMKFGMKCVKKLANPSVCIYTVPNELGILLNSIKRMLNTLHPKIEMQVKSWGSCIPDGGNAAPGECLSTITVMLRAKFRSYVEAVVEKLAENTKVQSKTKIKKILEDSKEAMVESDVRSRMQPLKDQLENTIDHLHSLFDSPIFIAICRGYWERLGQDVLSFLGNGKENQMWYEGSRIAVAVLNDTFASQMQQLLGKAIFPPASIREVCSMLCKDPVDHQNCNFYY